MMPQRFAIAAAVLIVARAAGQESTVIGGMCSRAAPLPHCSSILLTNFGVYGIVGTLSTYKHSHVGFNADWGFLLPSGRRAAMGASVLAAWDADGVGVGPAFRYRRWAASQNSSIELALGVPIAHFGDGATTSIFGLLKWNDRGVLGLSLRTAWRKGTDATCVQLPVFSCTSSARRGFALSAGVEVAGALGVLATAALPLAYVVALIAGGGGG